MINGQLLSNAEVTDILQNADVICKRYVFGRGSAYTFWNSNRRMLSLFNKFIDNLDEFHKNCIRQFLNTAPYFAQCNMFICRKEVIDKYCEWLFYELSKLKKEDFASLRRSIGYVAEFIFGAWLMIHNYKIHYQTVKEFR